MTEQHAFIFLLNQPSSLATISTLIVTICRRASTKHGNAAASEARIEAGFEGCYASMQPKSCSADCTKLLLIRAKRD